MWRTGSSFDGEGFSLSDPKLYRLLEETDGQPIELDISESPSLRRAKSRALWRDNRDKWRNERC
jgi:hypothetical protein